MPLPLSAMTELLTVAGMLFVPVVAFLGLIYKVVSEQRETSRSIENQVKNSHNINLRDDLDDKHSEVVEMFKAVNHRLEIIDNTQVRHQSHIDKLWGKVHNLDRNNNNGG